MINLDKTNNNFAVDSSCVSIDLLISHLSDAWTAPVRCQWSQCLSSEWTAQSAQSLSAPYRTSSPEISPMFNVLMRAKHPNRWISKPNLCFREFICRLGKLEVYYRQIMIEHSDFKMRSLGKIAIWAISIKFNQRQIINNLCNILAKTDDLHTSMILPR